MLTTDEHEADVTGRDLAGDAQRCDLVIELAIAARVEVPARDGQGGQITIAIPHTDEGMELTLDMMEHQVTRALTCDDNAWSRAWMKLVPRVTRRLSRRGASSENGVRFAARQLVLTCDLVDTPAAGADIPPGTAWGEVLVLMEVDQTLAPIAAMLREQIEGNDVPDWARTAQMLGVPLEVMDQLGVLPTLDDQGVPMALDSVIFDEEGDRVTVIDASMTAIEAS